jgi:hypothetical protein
MPDETARRLGYEMRDINVRVVARFALGLVIAGVVIHLATVALFHVFKREHPSPEPPSRIAQQPRVVSPPPRLQRNPIADFEQFQAEQQALLSSYGWVDKTGGVIRIPIERAMDLIAERGLPTRGPGTQNASGSTPVQMQEQKAAATKP